MKTTNVVPPSPLRKDMMPLLFLPIIASSLQQPNFICPQDGDCGEVELYSILINAKNTLTYNRKQWKHNFLSIFLKLIHNHCCIFVNNVSNKIKETLLSLSTGPIHMYVIGFSSVTYDPKWSRYQQASDKIT